MKLACEKTQTHDDPISHMMVLIGDAKKASGKETINNPEYNCDDVTVPTGKTKSSPCNLLITMKPPTIKTMTNNKRVFVMSA